MFRSAKESFWIGDTAHILHGNMLVVWAHHMIDLTEGKPDPKWFLVKINRSFRYSEDQVSSQAFLQWLPYKDSLAWVHTIVIFENFEVPCADCEQVRWYSCCLFKLIDKDILCFIKVQKWLYTMPFKHKTPRLTIKASFATITNNTPLSGASHYQGHFCFEVRLVKTRENLIAMKRLKLWIQILLLIAWVCVRMQADPIRLVSIQVFKLNCIPAQLHIRWLQSDSRVLKDVLTLKLVIVYADICNGKCLKIKE